MSDKVRLHLRLTPETYQLIGEYAKNHSSTMRISVQMRMQKGIFTPPSAPYGYRLVNRNLEVIPAEAEVVRKIYASYLSGQGFADIARSLNRSEVERGRMGRTWHPRTIQYILTNVSYTGDMIWQKTFATSTIPFRQIENRGQKPKYFVEDCQQPIVSKEDFQRVQNLMVLRQKQFAGAEPRPEASCLSGIAVCEQAGRPRLGNQPEYGETLQPDAGSDAAAHAAAGHRA